MKNSNSLDISSRKAWYIAIVLWLVAVLAFFSPAIFNNKVIAPIDCLECVFRPFADKPIENVHNHFVVDGISQYLPYKWSIKTSFEEDGYVGWTPYTFNGNPISDNTMVSPGDPLNLLYAVLPFWQAWDLGIILQFFIAGCGMILLMKHFKIPVWGALLAAVSFSFYSQFILFMYHKWLGAMVWAPFLVWALLRYKRNLINVPAIVFMALIWRTGHLQSCVFGFILVACVWGANVWKKDNIWPTRKDFLKKTASFLLTGVLGALLSLDVFVDTLQRMEGCKSMLFSWGFSNICTFITLLFPTSLGIAETLDASKFFNQSLFGLKFGGGTVFILALIAIFNKRAPLTAKVIFVASILAVCTPLLTYLYNRSTIIMALGMAWLATWQLQAFTREPLSPTLRKRIYLALGSLLGIWFLVSVGVSFFSDEIATLLNDAIHDTLNHHRAGRITWYEQRAERYISHILLWDWRNLLLAICLILGVFCCSRIRPNGKNTRWMAGVVVLTYIELLVFSSTWITYSEKPEGPYLYNAPLWMAEFKSHVKDGSVRTRNTAGDLDFLCNNTFSAYNVRLAGGYETFRPKYLAPLQAGYAPEDYAQAGISHIISDTRWIDSPIPGWELVMTGPDFKLYANPAYMGRYFADGTPITPDKRTANRIHLTIPPNAQNITILESFHPGWKAYAGDEELTITATERGGMSIALPPRASEQQLHLEFHMPYCKWYHSIMLATLLSLIVIAIRQKHSKRKENI
ncbi:MAG: hypothetical protein IJ943_03000 [Akkermansia sp.]|nr:hypothetical protein [Akkermansia sp.]